VHRACPYLPSESNLYRTILGSAGRIAILAASFLVLLFLSRSSRGGKMARRRTQSRPMHPGNTRTYRFGPFFFDARSGELMRDGRRSRLPLQSAIVLETLLARPREVITREELRAQLWPNRTVVDFDHGLANALQRLRDALGESAAEPRYVETLPRRGYRFVAAVEPVPAGDPEPAEPARSGVPRRGAAWTLAAAGALACLAMVAALLPWTPLPVATSDPRGSDDARDAPIPPAAPATLARGETSNPEAREAWLRGKWFLKQKSPEGITRSIDYFRQAVALDPGYARAHASLATSLHFAGAVGVLDRAEAQRLTRESADAALALDPEAGDALAILAESRFRFGGETEGIEALFRRAAALRPHDPDVLHWFGMFLAITGNVREALVQLERARALDPLALHLNSDYAAVLAMAGQRDEAMQELARVRELDPGFAKAWLVEADIALDDGRHAEAIAALQRANELSPETPKYVASLARVYARAGRTVEARATLGELRGLAGRVHVAPELVQAVEDDLAGR
jgi:DNA-binding winged helix-turn-helix (wHTH) protein/Tfp pilus assembly protein PilF